MARRGWSGAVLAVVLLVGAGSAPGDEPSPRPPSPATPERAADAVLGARRSGDPDALRTLAAKDDPDPWLVADALVEQDEHDAAEALALAAPRPDVEGIPAYVAARRRAQHDPARRARWQSAAAALAEREPQRVLEALGPRPAEVPPEVPALHAEYLRGLAYTSLRRPGEAAETFRLVARGAEGIGWLSLAFRACHAWGVSAYDGSEFPAAREAHQRCRALCQRRGDAAGAARALANLGLAQLAVGDHAESLATQTRAFAEFEALGDQASAAATMRGIGVVHHARGDHDQALESYRRAIAVHDALGDAQQVAQTLANVANVHLARDEDDQALAAYQRALAILESLGEQAGVARILGNMALLSQGRGDHRTAIPQLERALRMKREVGDRVSAARTLANLGISYQATGDGAAALAAYEQAHTEQRALGDRSGAARTLGSIASLHKDRGDYRKALSAYRRAMRDMEALGDRSGAAATAANLGVVHSHLGDLPEALLAYERAAGEYEALGDRSGAAGALLNIGNVHETRADYDDALRAFHRAFEAFEALGRPQHAAGALLGMSNVQRARGDYAAALGSAQRARETFEALGLQREAAGAGVALANVWGDQGAYGKALEGYERARGDLQDLGDRANAAVALSNLAGVHAKLGAYATARTLTEQAIAELEALGDRAEAARVRAQLGAQMSAQGEFSRALSVLENALSVQEALGLKGAAAVTTGMLGALYQELGDDVRALTLWERAVGVLEQAGERAAAAAMSANIGHLHIQAGRPTEALPALERAHAVHVALGARAAAGETLAIVAYAHLESGDVGAALAASRRAHESLLGLGRARSALGALLIRGRAEHASGDPGAARDTHRQGLKEAEAMALSPLAADFQQGLAVLSLALGDPAGAADFARQAVVAGGRLARGLGSEDAVQARSLVVPAAEVGLRATAAARDLGGATWFLEAGRAGALLEEFGARQALWNAVVPEDLRREEALARGAETAAVRALELALRGGDRAQVRARRKDVEAAREEVARVFAGIQREAKAAASLLHPEPASLADVRSALGEGEAMVLYAFLAEEALALVVEPTGARLVALGDAAPIRAAAELAVPARPGTDSGPALAALADRVVTPLRLGTATRRLLVSPSDALSSVPLGLLVPGVEVAYVPSATAYRLLREDGARRGEGVLALGDPDYGAAGDGAVGGALGAGGYSRVRPLGTPEEAEAVGTRVLLGPDATRAGFLRATSERPRWRSVHLACHGVLDLHRPARSALALTPAGEDDGLLTCLDVFRLRLPSDVVVLSACETARGKVMRGEGVVGLARAFLFAGTPRVICSLWKVDDEATRALMKEFYRLWSPKDGSRGLATAAALKAAQEHVRTREQEVVDDQATSLAGREVRKRVRPWQHPYYWAAWVLWGLPD